jgi:hypothetical protein
LNPSPNQAGDAQWAAPAWFGKIFKNHWPKIRVVGTHFDQDDKM